MTPEQKDLLLKDLCARLLYDIKFPITWPDPITSEPIETTGTISDINRYGIVSFVWDYEGQEILQKNDLHIKDVKPYLFPLSSMTEEQYNEMQTISGKDCMEHMEIEKEWRNNSPFTHLPLYQHRVIEFFHKYHFDYRGLIPMGLAIDATGKNIY